jgi:hypothetical protein
MFCRSLFVLLYFFFWPLCCLSFFDIRILITPLVSFDHCVVCPSSIYGLWLPLWYLLAIVLSVLLRYTNSDYPFGIFWPFCCLSFFDIRILITPLVSFGHCVVCPSSIYGFWLPLCYLQTSLKYRITHSHTNSFISFRDWKYKFLPLSRFLMLTIYDTAQPFQAAMSDHVSFHWARCLQLWMPWLC